MFLASATRTQTATAQQCTWSHGAEEEGIQRQVCEAAMQQHAGEQPPGLPRLQHCSITTTTTASSSSHVPCQAECVGLLVLTCSIAGMWTRACMPKIRQLSQAGAHIAPAHGNCLCWGMRAPVHAPDGERGSMLAGGRWRQPTTPGAHCDSSLSHTHAYLLSAAWPTPAPSALLRLGPAPLPARCLLHTLPAG